LPIIIMHSEIQILFPRPIGNRKKFLLAEHTPAFQVEEASSGFASCMLVRHGAAKWFEELVENEIGGAAHFPGRIGLGTWPIGESGEHRDREIAAIRHALDIGYRLLDTAEMYADGGAERIIGSALKAFGASRRSELYIVSKLVPDNATREGVVRACEASIQRMGCQYLDMYLLHWRGPHPFVQTLRGFDDLLRRGLIRHVGVSNFGVDDLRLWLEAERSVGLPASTRCNQMPYSADARGIEYELLPWQRAHAIQTIAYSPLGRGALTRNEVLARLGRERGVTGAQIALAWCLREPDVIAIPKSANPQRMQENLAAAALRLSPEELELIDRAFPLRFRRLRQSRVFRHTKSAVRRLLRRRR
jgi:diketogulonate reductase-like aldo/keto reductase